MSNVPVKTDKQTDFGKSKDNNEIPRILEIVVKFSESVMMEDIRLRVLCFLYSLGGGATSKRGTFGNVGKQDSMMCVAFGKSGDICYTGGQNGNVYIWQGTTLSKTLKSHEGPCFAMHSLDKVCLL